MYCSINGFLKFTWLTGLKTHVLQIFPIPMVWGVFGKCAAVPLKDIKSTWLCQKFSRT